MTENDYDSFCEIVAGCAELKGRQLSAPAIELYWRAMRHWSIEEFRQAAEHLLRRCAFMPEPKDFEDLRRAGRLTPGEAWLKALKHCSSGEWSSGPPCDDPRVTAAARMIGGFRSMALCPIDKLGFLERRFCEHYADLEEVDDVRAALPQIALSSRRLSGPQPIGQIVADIARET